MNHSGKVVSVNVSDSKGTTKKPVSKITLDRLGIVGDAHRGSWHRQVSLLSEERITAFSKKSDIAIGYGDFAENITVTGLSLCAVKIYDRFVAGKTEIEVTQIGKECHGNDCAIFEKVGKCLMPEEGIFGRVLLGGSIKPGDSIDYIPRSLKISILTLSDRASNGVYADKSGPTIKKALDEYLPSIGWGAVYATLIIPDDRRILKVEMKKALSSRSDIIVTTGGTGLSGRDITPDVIRPMLEKEIPGIMEIIRIKYGKDFPNAVLSRSIAGIIGRTLVYVLPGSPKAVAEYMEEICKTIEHCILMTRGFKIKNH